MVVHAFNPALWKADRQMPTVLNSELENSQDYIKRPCRLKGNLVVGGERERELTEMEGEIHWAGSTHL